MPELGDLDLGAELDAFEDDGASADGPAPIPPSSPPAPPTGTIEALLAMMDAMPLVFRAPGIKLNGHPETEMDVIASTLYEADMAVKNAVDPISRLLKQRWFDRVQRLYNTKAYVK